MLLSISGQTIEIAKVFLNKAVGNLKGVIAKCYLSQLVTVLIIPELMITQYDVAMYCSTYEEVYYKNGHDCI